MENTTRDLFKENYDTLLFVENTINYNEQNINIFIEKEDIDINILYENLFNETEDSYKKKVENEQQKLIRKKEANKKKI